MAWRRAWTIGMMACAAPALAQESGRASDRALAPLVACRQIADPRAKAGCYDSALDRLQQSVVARNVVIVDHEQAAVDRKALFGFSGEHVAARPARAPRAAKAAPPPAEEVAEVDSTVVSATQYGYDQWTVRIATGAIWRTTEGGIPFAPKPGSPVRIRRGVMGGFMMRVSARSVRAIRVG